VGKGLRRQIDCRKSHGWREGEREAGRQAESGRAYHKLSVPGGSDDEVPQKGIIGESVRPRNACPSPEAPRPRERSTLNGRSADAGDPSITRCHPASPLLVGLPASDSLLPFLPGGRTFLPGVLRSPEGLGWASPSRFCEAVGVVEPSKGRVPRPPDTFLHHNPSFPRKPTPGTGSGSRSGRAACVKRSSCQLRGFGADPLIC
jgi:hypothetical protein